MAAVQPSLRHGPKATPLTNIEFTKLCTSACFDTITWVLIRQRRRVDDCCYLRSIVRSVLQDLFLLILFQTGEMGLDMGAQGDPLAYRQDGEWRFIT